MKVMASCAGALGIVMSVAVSPAGAYPVVNGTPDGAPAPYPATSEQLVAENGSHLIERGDPVPEVAALGGGFSKGVPLNEALKLLLPVGWKAAVSSDVDGQRQVKWSGGSWIDALKTVGLQARVRVTVVWPRQAVLVDPFPAAQGEDPAVDAVALVTEQARGVESPATTQGVAAAPTAKSPVPSVKAESAAGTPIDYPDEESFLQERVEIDRRDVTLKHALQLILPEGWQPDFRVSAADLPKRQVEITYAGPRGVLLHALGRRYNVAIIPYRTFKKVIITDGRK